MVGYNLGSAFGFELVPAGIGSLIIGTQPLLIAAFGTILAREPLNMPTVIGLVAAFAGTTLLAWNDLLIAENGRSLVMGGLFIFFSGVAWAIYVVGAKPLIRTYGTYPITALSISIAASVMIAGLARPETLATVQAMTARNWLDMAFLAGLSTFIATITWNYGASRLPAAASGAFIYLVPIAGVAAGAAILAEPVTPGMLAGGGLILLGVAIAQIGPRMQKAQLDPHS